ncbi:glycosyltransferase family 8 protein [Bryobacter aggregatus]|uniref:glycosyltransferase family 8 protein n=1 Tax=Bryobacter aggregatus TaxID=360054 RepID=UPI00055B05CE|nr:glycosyltransferase family 8 protein [Bryobacter aggregatus]
MSSRELIQVITLADDRYALPLAVMVRSLLDHLEEDRRVRLTVIDGGILATTKRKLVDSWRNAAAFPRLELRWHAPDYGNLGAVGEWGRVPKLTYARINLQAYLPVEERVILLDSDVVVQTCIGKLWDTPLEGAVAAATVDPFIPKVSSHDGLAGYERLGLAGDAPYFNAGVMLVDLQLWRRMGGGQKALAFAGENWKLARYYDQDALNVVLAGKWKQLDARWQQQPRLARFLDRKSSNRNDAWIIHFSGRLKPWMYHLASEADREFFAVMDRTEWRGSRPPHTLQSALTEFYERWLRRMLYPFESRTLNLLGRFARSRKATDSLSASKDPGVESVASY